VPRPDALFLPETVKRGERIFERVSAVCRIAEPLLECDYPREKAYIRKMPHGRLFITRDPADTILYPINHPKSGQPRYRWEKRDGGMQVGYLIEEPSARREDAPQAGV
jgi:hypothetical protein